MVRFHGAQESHRSRGLITGVRVSEERRQAGRTGGGGVRRGDRQRSPDTLHGDRESAQLEDAGQPGRHFGMLTAVLFCPKPVSYLSGHVGFCEYAYFLYSFPFYQDPFRKNMPQRLFSHTHHQGIFT